MNAPFAPSQKSKLHYLVITLFFLLLWAPLLQMLFKVLPEANLHENRQLAPLPTFDVFSLRDTKFQKAFEGYYTDHFGFRKMLIYLNNYIKTSQLSVSPHPMIGIGKEGWYYYDYPMQGVLFKDYMGLVRYDSAKLIRLADNLDMIHASLAKAGIHFVLMIAPDKQTIYPEYMPDSVQKHRSRTRLDHVLEYLHREKPHILIIDPRVNLIKAKNDLPPAIYYKADTHWNTYGAFVVYQQMIKVLSGLISVTKALRLDDYRVTHRAHIGDIAKMLSMENHISDDAWFFSPKKPVAMDISNPGYQEPNEPESIGFNQNKSSLPRLLMYHDSFAVHLIPFLAPHFSHSTFVPNYMITPAHIGAEKPDIVVLQIVERNLDKLLEVSNIFRR